MLGITTLWTDRWYWIVTITWSLGVVAWILNHWKRGAGTSAKASNSWVIVSLRVRAFFMYNIKVKPDNEVVILD